VHGWDAYVSLSMACLYVGGFRYGDDGVYDELRISQAWPSLRLDYKLGALGYINCGQQWWEGDEGIRAYTYAYGKLNQPGTR
jgi:hypothetical protein